MAEVTCPECGRPIGEMELAELFEGEDRHRAIRRVACKGCKVDFAVLRAVERPAYRAERLGANGA